MNTLNLLFTYSEKLCTILLAYISFYYDFLALIAFTDDNILTKNVCLDSNSLTISFDRSESDFVAENVDEKGKISEIFFEL